MELAQSERLELWEQLVLLAEEGDLEEISQAKDPPQLLGGISQLQWHLTLEVTSQLWLLQTLADTSQQLQLQMWLQEDSNPLQFQTLQAINLQIKCQAFQIKHPFHPQSEADISLQEWLLLQTMEPEEDASLTNLSQLQLHQKSRPEIHLQMLGSLSQLAQLAEQEATILQWDSHQLDLETTTTPSSLE